MHALCTLGAGAGKGARCLLLVPVVSHLTFSVELAFGTIESTPKTVKLQSIQNGNYNNLHDFHMIIVMLCGALVSKTLCVFG